MGDGASSAVGPVLSFIGLGNELQGQQEELQAAKEAADFNTKVAGENAQLAKDQAREDERKLRLQSMKQIGSSRAGYGAAGVTTDGSPMEVLGESAANAELDALTIRHEGDLKAYRYNQDAALENMKLAAAEKSANRKSAAAVIGFGSKMADKAPVGRRT